LWGLAEATIGYLLHWLPALIAGSVMFPIGAAILMRAYARSGSRKMLFFIGVVAAVIKAADFILPVISPWKVVNPMICIILEASVVAAVALLVEKRPVMARLALLPAASIAWRFLFLGVLGLQFLATGSLSVQISSLENIVSFAVWSGLLSGALAVGLDFLRRMAPSAFVKPFTRPAFAGVLLAAALVVTVLL
ncbi:MAG: hypothetical protein V1761_03315, partial [bacterium]